MSIELNIAISPKGAAAAALTNAHKEHKNGAPATASSQQRRSSKFERNVPGTMIPMEVIRTEADPKIKGSIASYNCISNPADYLIGKNALSSASHTQKLVPLQLALFKVLQKLQHPGLSDNVLESITIANCRLESLTIPYYFEYENQTEAYRSLLDLHAHLKVVLDSGGRLPTRSTTWKKSPPRVHSDPDCRHAFFVTLPFGQARISLKREIDEYPATFQKVDSVKDRTYLIAKTRCLLCIEIKVDLYKFNHFYRAEPELQLPSDSRLWTHDKMLKDPVKQIWDSFRYETWFNVPLATDNADIDQTRLAWQFQEVAESYLAGKNVTRHTHIGGDPKKFVQFREALISKAHIDILNPWAINKLNLSKDLGPQFVDENRFDLSNDPDFAQHALTKGNIKEAVRKFDYAMQGKPGWMFDTSEYEAT